MAPHRAGVVETGGVHVVGPGRVVSIGVVAGVDVVGSGRVVAGGVACTDVVGGSSGEVATGDVAICEGEVVAGDVAICEGEVEAGEVATGDVEIVDEVVGVVAGVLPPLSASAGTAMPTAPSATAPATITIRLRTCSSSR
ncbi:hypothetical protein [Lentzea sp.]|uniref:hypothetical protein n=1 Tax=Lentzea sp. TaxID=56099 RepID=UPI002ED38C61